MFQIYPKLQEKNLYQQNSCTCTSFAHVLQQHIYVLADSLQCMLHITPTKYSQEICFVNAIETYFSRG